MLDSLYLIFPFILAGVMNGSFVVPTKYIQDWPNEKIWLYHTILGVLFLPWLILFFCFPSALDNYRYLSSSHWLLLLIGGLAFGLGQLCFSYAIKFIGIALSFTINLGMGVTIGSLFVVLYQSALFTERGYLAIAALGLILASLIMSYYSGKNEKKPLDVKKSRSLYTIGWLLALLAGLISGLQNIVFYVVAFGTQLPSPTSFWVWPAFLSMAAIPMFIGFLYLSQRTPIQDPMKGSSVTFKNIVLITGMGLLFTGSLALYSMAMDHLSRSQQIIGWPAFMLAIILTSQLWGWFHKEAPPTTFIKKTAKISSIILLILAISLLSMNS